MAGGPESASLEALPKQELFPIPEQYKELFGYEEFEAVFQGLSDDKKERISKVFQSQVDNTDFSQYLEDTFFALTALDEGEIQFLEEKYSLESQAMIVQDKGNEETVQKREETTQEREETAQENIDKMIKAKELSKKLFDKYPDILGTFDESNPEANFRLIEEKSQDILKAAYEQDVKEGRVDEQGNPTSDSEFARVNTQLQSLANLGAISNFTVTLGDYVRQPDNARTLSDEKAAELAIDTSTYAPTTVSGDEVSYGDQVIDFSENPPVKYIASGENPEWRFESTELDFQRDTELYAQKDALNAELGEIETSLTSLEKDIKTVKRQLAELPGLDLSKSLAREQLGKHFAALIPRTSIVDMIDSMENLSGTVLEDKIVDLKDEIRRFLENQAEKMQTQQTELQMQKADIEKKISEIDSRIATQEALFQAKVRERDENVRKVSAYCDSIGLTALPPSLMDTIFSQLNQNPALRAAVGFNAGEINLAEGQLGVEDIGAGEGIDDINNRIKFAELINKMIGVKDENGNPPINVERMRAGGAPVGDRMKFTTLLSESGLLDVGGVATAIAKLKQQEQKQELK